MVRRYCAVYLRVSTSSQELGMESQERAIKAYLDLNQITEYKIFSDLGHSGSKSSRPGLDEMLREVTSGKITYVVTFSLSRLGRNVRHLLELIEVFRKHDTVFVSITEKIDNSPVGKLLLAILGALSEMELQNTRSRVLSGLANARAKGIQLGRKKTINDELILELHSKNYNQNEIAQLVKCHPSTVSKILKLKKAQSDN